MQNEFSNGAQSSLAQKNAERFNLFAHTQAELNSVYKLILWFHKLNTEGINFWAQCIKFKIKLNAFVKGDCKVNISASIERKARKKNRKKIADLFLTKKK